MGALLAMLVGIFTNLFMGAVIIIVLIVFIVKSLVRKSQQSSDIECTDQIEEDDDGASRCFYELPEIRQHCVNCDLADQCLGISYEKKEDDDDDTFRWPL